MSYCRFSSDDYQCDAYVYEDGMGVFNIHLANNRVVGDIPKMPSLTECTSDEFLKAYKKQMKFMNTALSEPIILKYHGETFRTDTARECAEALIRFAKIGYHIPPYAIRTLLEEDMI